MHKLSHFIKGFFPGALAVMQQADWALLLFLCGLVQIKLAGKLAAIVAYAVYALVKKYFVKSRLPAPALFYLAIPVVGLLSSIVAGNFGYHNYIYAYSYTALLWLIAGAGFLLLYYTVLNVPAPKLINAIKLFVLINLLFCGYQFIVMCLQAHSPMPYWLHDEQLLYGVSSGDRMYGLFMDSSHVNAAANGLLMLFFIFRKQLKWAAICGFVIALCTSNLVFLLILVLLPVSYIANRDTDVRTTILKAGILYLLFYIIISPENLMYAKGLLYGEEQRKTRTAALYFYDNSFNESSIRTDLIALKTKNTANRQLHPNQPLDTGYTLALLSKWHGPQTYLQQAIKKGKAVALIRTFNYAFSGYKAFALGAGPACFSSKTAFKVTGMGWQGNYPDEKIFIAKPFFENHFLIELYYLAKPVSFHSIANKPGSVYHQLIGEYGFLGFALFCYCYLYFFYRGSKGSAGCIILLTAMFLLFAVDYWFEMLSLTFIFEFLILIPTTTKQGNGPITSGHSVNAGV